MPAYELALILRNMPRPELIATLKRTAESILNRGGIIRNLNNMGTRTLPYKINNHDLVHKIGTYFIVEFDAAPMKLDELQEEMSRDIDIIRKNIFKLEETPRIECTLHEELLPPAYRKEVQEMMRIGQKKQKKKFSYNSGFDYYPFQK